MARLRTLMKSRANYIVNEALDRAIKIEVEKLKRSKINEKLFNHYISIIFG